ncbi:CAP-associated domain-containing protein [Paenibacillus agricola]|uniref:Copper amine oxidase n=1 Tax=Paenibacillus agricola TaxID=2716264 RepID=A0ABX0J8V1_9BACL|nr:CAP-associated domain-containing protein [Paenibacillus agricola]NHN31825.1 copper amine oxidase [Paenibacillus agricola]
MKTWIQYLLPVALTTALLLTPIASLPLSYAASVTFSDTSRHWGAAAIDWAIQNGVVDGYADGTFQPDRQVTEPEFLAMLLRAYPEVKLPAATTGSAWYKPYYDIAAAQNWPVLPANNRDSFNRGHVALIIAATQKGTVSLTDAITYLLDQGLSSGKTAATVEGYKAADKLSRAESVQFIRNLKQKQFQLQPAAAPSGPSPNVPAPAVPAPTLPTVPVQPALPTASTDSSSTAVVTLKGVKLGDSLEATLAKLGAPARQDASEYGFTWYVYNQDYSSYAQIGIGEGKVVALYTPSANWQNNKGIADGSAQAQVTSQYGAPLESIKKGNTRFIMNYGKNEYATYEIDGAYVTFFYDLFLGNVVTGVQAVTKPYELALDSFYPDASAALIASYEREAFDLANAHRTKLSKAILTWDATISGTARKHSQDMAAQNYFAHESPDGKSPFDRMRDDGLKLSSASENIAAGQTSAIFAHHGWMNSEGHRIALLSDIKYLGVGVAFGGKMSIYYTENFYTP